MPPRRLDEDEISVGIVGNTGSGKSTFINAVLGEDQAPVDGGTYSSTETVHGYDYTLPSGQRIVLVDTPGFNCHFPPDVSVRTPTSTDILKRMNDYIGKRGFSYTFIIQSVMCRDGCEARDERRVKRLCPDISKVFIVTTHWDVLDPAVEERATEIEEDLAQSNPFLRYLEGKATKDMYYRSGKDTISLPVPGYVTPRDIIHQLCDPSIPVTPSIPVNLRAVERSRSLAISYLSSGTASEDHVDTMTRWLVSRDPCKAPLAAVASTTPFLWLAGPAGCRKTDIMKKVVGRCKDADIALLSYFFSRSDGHDKVMAGIAPFMATLAHQLWTKRVGGLPFERFAVGMTLDQQTEVLLNQISQLSAPSHPSFRVVIAVDGLDECSKPRERQELLRLLHCMVKSAPDTISIIIASRPEIDIQWAFGNEQFRSVTQVINLTKEDDDDIKEPLFGADNDDASIQEQVVDVSVGLSLNLQGQPAVDLLEHVLIPTGDGLSSNPPTVTEFSALYPFLLPLDNPDRSSKFLLHSIIGMSAVDNHGPSPALLDQWLSLPNGTTTRALRDLHCILSILSLDSDEAKSIRFHRKSLEDFLTDPSRAKNLFQEPSETHTQLATACTRHLKEWAENGTNDGNECTRYAGQHWDDHIVLSFLTLQDGREQSLPNDILEFDPRVVWRYRFVTGKSFFSVGDIRDRFHRSTCEGDRCLPFCRILARMSQCSQRVEAFRRRYQGISSIGKFEILRMFDVETGLYDVTKAGKVIVGVHAIAEGAGVSQPVAAETDVSEVPQDDTDPQPDTGTNVPAGPVRVNPFFKAIRVLLSGCSSLSSTVARLLLFVYRRVLPALGLRLDHFYAWVLIRALSSPR